MATMSHIGVDKAMSRKANNFRFFRLLFWLNLMSQVLNIIYLNSGLSSLMFKICCNAVCKKVANVYMGPYNRTQTAALRQAKFYLPWQAAVPQ